MRLVTLCSLLVLTACETGPAATEDTATLDIDTGPIEPEICFVGESSAGANNASGDACPQPDSPIPYSMMGPNVMLLVDISGSMSNFGKWQEVQSLVPYLPAVGSRANLGMSVFPSPDSGGCSLDDNGVVPLQQGVTGAEQVAAFLQSLQPDGYTPMADALDKLASEPGLTCSNRDNIVVLLSDGMESCNGDPVRAARDLTGADVPIELFVIGFGTDAVTNTQLSQIARAAEPSTGPDNFYTASTVEELLTRLYAVTATCTAQLDTAIATENLTVTLDGESVPLCNEERCEYGFSYDEDRATVRLEGTDCMALNDGQCHDLSFAAE